MAYSKQTKELVLNLISSGYSLSEISKEYKIDVSTLSRWKGKEDKQSRLTVQNLKAQIAELSKGKSSDRKAKQIAMLQRYEKGTQARKYFIQVENAWNSPERVMARALTIANKTIAALEVENKEMKPKALFADAVAQSDTSILVYDLAKLICQNGIKIGGNRLWTWLRENGFIFKHSCEPTQKSMEMKLFEVIERTVQRSGHDPKVTRTTRVTGKGQVYFINKFLESQKGEQIC